MNYYIGIDIGTSSSKGVLFDSLGNAIREKSVEYDMITPMPSYAEEDPIDFKNATLEILKDLAKEGKEIKGIGLSGQMHGLICLDKDNNVIRNAIIWCDNRTTNEAKEIKDSLTDLKVKEITGSYTMPAFTLAKLLWIKNNEPENYKKIAHILLPKDYVRFILTGKYITDFTDASGMQMLDIKNKKYSEEILNAFNIDKSILPELVESYEISGYLTDDIKKLTGLKGDIFVVGGAGDQAAAATGLGIVDTNDISISLGSSGVVFNPITLDDIKNSKLQVFMHTTSNYHVMGVTNGCGLSYKWFKDELCKYETKEAKDLGISVYDTLNNLAESSNPNNGLIYLPYLNGERTPHLDPYASGTFIGIRQNTTKADMIRSILEGVSYSLKESIDLLPKKEYNLYVSGGGAKSKLWLQILASVLNLEIKTIKSNEGGALGVAILAMVCQKEYKDIKDACSKIIKVNQTIKPDKDLVKIYEKGYEIYKKAYLSLKDFYKYKESEKK